jgi:hypothetical protein
VKILERERQIIRERAVVVNDAEDFPAGAMAREFSLAESANGIETECTAGDVDLAYDALSNPVLPLDRRTGDIRHFTDKFMTWCATERVIPPEYFEVGIANAGETDTNESPAGPKFWNRLTS